MATIVIFPGAKGRRPEAAGEQASEAGRSAELLLFTGVRYERHTDHDEAVDERDDPGADFPPMNERN
ncbi:MAG: hypothetical protein NW205_10965 [Hyphomicrobiaceae bacterium]|nr:hypothetical protein [Hyphomicrobiaceae bacterium]